MFVRTKYTRRQIKWLESHIQKVWSFRKAHNSLKSEKDPAKRRTLEKEIAKSFSKITRGEKYGNQIGFRPDLIIVLNRKIRELSDKGLSPEEISEKCKSL